MSKIKISWLKSDYYIWIHWFGGNKHSFDMLKLFLLEKYPTSIILTPELKWHGKQISTLSTKQWDRTFENYLSDIAKKVKDLISQYNIDTFTLIGHSLWWALSVELAQIAGIKEKISRLILINPALYKPKSLWFYKYFDQINNYFSKKPKTLAILSSIALQIYKLSFSKELLKKWLSSVVKWRYKRYISKSNIYTNYVQHFYAEQGKNAKFLQYFWLSAINFLHQHIDFHRSIDSIAFQTMVLHGDKDNRFRSKEISKLCENNSFITFEKVSKLWHNPHEEDPELIVEKILDFCRR